ncbi:uncharacterized protein [Anabrus simplex]|uniref:uncharacterized protein isoform X2 n=1 Tax=Anabrus simplex TaxID=316456 RepID=UPI0035A31CDB
MSLSFVITGTSEEFVESVEELRARLDAMKRLMGDDLERKRQKRKKLSGESIIDGSFLSVVFGVVLLMIIGVSFYAFMNLYYAILKKFPAQQHTEL